jgi:ribosomal protein S18 acetylase RimI-like enzyme
VTAQVVSGPRLRDLAGSEPRQLGNLLDAAFSGYRNATRFAQPVLDFLDDWAWAEHPLSVGVETVSGLVAVGMGTLRQARWQGHNVTAVHLGPIGVLPGHRRRGLGGRLVQALEARARAQGADVLTLTTEVVYGAWRLYERQGFEVLETYRPVVRPLFSGLPDSSGPPDPLHVERVDPAAFSDRFVQPEGRADAVVETWTHEPNPARVLRPRYLVCEDAAIATMRWPVLSRAPAGRVQVWATQVLRVCGDGAPRAAVLTQAARFARQDQAVCIYALPTAAVELPGFSTRGAPLVHRMVRPLTRLGQRLARDAGAWDEVCPAP